MTHNHTNEDLCTVFVLINGTILCFDENDLRILLTGPGKFYYSPSITRDTYCTLDERNLQKHGKKIKM